MSRVCIAALVFLLLIDARPVFAVGGGGGLGLVWVEPVGGFRETADPSAAISMWGAIGPRFSPWRLRFEWHFIEEHEVAGFPDPLYVPYPGLTGPNTVWVYTEVNGVTIGPMLDSHLGRLPALAWLAIGFDDFEPSYGTSYMGAPNTFGDEPGAPGGILLLGRDRRRDPPVRVTPGGKGRRLRHRGRVPRPPECQLPRPPGGG